MPRPRILFICDKNERTSFGRLTLNLVDSVRGEYDPHVLWLKTPKFFGKRSQNAVPEISGTHPSFHSLWASSLYSGYLGFRHRLKRLVRQLNPEVVFFIRPELGFLVPVVKGAMKDSMGVKTVMFVHDTFAETLYPRSLKFWLLNHFYIRPTMRSDAFVYNSQWTRGEAAAYFGPEMADAPGEVIGCPVDRQFFCPPEKPLTEKERVAFMESYGIKGFKSMCLNVSLAEPRKNVQTFLRMAKLRPDTAFVRVGRSSSAIRRYIRENGLKNVFQFREFSAFELRDFYRNSTLMVYPSFLEGFGLPPIEAIACGTPAVCASTSAVKENLEGVCPLVLNPRDAESFAQVLDRVLAGESVVNAERASELLDRCSAEAFKARVISVLSHLF